jgi:hypothetical protein
MTSARWGCVRVFYVVFRNDALTVLLYLRCVCAKLEVCVLGCCSAVSCFECCLCFQPSRSFCLLDHCFM